MDYIYDLAGKIKQVTDPPGTYGMAYDNMGRLLGTTTALDFRNRVRRGLMSHLDARNDALPKTLLCCSNFKHAICFDNGSFVG